MSGRPHRKPWPPTQHQPRPSLKRSLTSIISSFSRKATREKAPRKAASWHEGWETTADPRRVRMAPEPPLYSRATHPRTEIVESGGSALVDAQDAFTNSKQAVWTRILWSFPSEHDTSAQMTLARIESRGVVEGLASLGVRKYLETGKGAIFCSAQHNANDSRRLLVDWVTFRDTQRTRDKLLQQDVLRNDPGATVMVYVFKLSSDKRSVAIWRRRIPLSSNIQGRNSAAISVKKRQMKAIEDDYVIKISPANNDMARGSSLRRLATLTRRGIHA